MLSSTAPALNPLRAPVTLRIGPFATTIPAGSFKKHEHEGEDEHEHEHEGGFFSFHGVIDGVELGARITPTGTLHYTFDAGAKGANLAGTTNPVQVMLTIGGDSGATSVTAQINQ
jgi:hypothetical protein